MRRLALAVVVLAGLLLLVDRVGAAYASRAIAEELLASPDLDTLPAVDVTGFPFLTQAVTGRYERVEVSAEDVLAGDLLLSRLDVTLHEALVPLPEVLRQAVDAVPVEQVTARALVQYDQMSQSFAGQELTVASAGDRVLLTGSLQDFDATLDVEALAGVEVVDGEIVVTAEEVAFGPAGERRELTSAVRDALDVRVPLAEFPFDLVLTEAMVRPDGLALRAEAADVVLTAS